MEQDGLNCAPSMVMAHSSHPSDGQVPFRPPHFAMQVCLGFCCPLSGVARFVQVAPRTHRVGQMLSLSVVRFVKAVQWTSREPDFEARF